jgi:hypothetical protein
VFFLLLAFAMKAIDCASLSITESHPSAAQSRRESDDVRQDVNLENTLSSSRAPVQASAWPQSGLLDNLGGNSHLILSCNTGYHGYRVSLDQSFVKETGTSLKSGHLETYEGFLPDSGRTPLLLTSSRHS